MQNRTAPGIYVHVPFCMSKCGYCDFYSVTSLERIADYVAAVAREMALNRGWSSSADTLYCGGGTPSLLSPLQIERLIETAATCLGLAGNSEITLEMNPATATLDQLQGFRSAGVNRLTIGVQSFRTHLLDCLGRLHSVDQAFEAIALARRAGFTNIAIDLMYGLPGQTQADWCGDLRQAVAAQVEHISCYMLSLEPGTPMQGKVDAGRLVLPSEEHTAALFHLAQRELTAAGYDHYEIANFARNSTLRSRHNQKYWNFIAYLGLGPAAHSYNPPRRWWNLCSLDGYLEDLSRHRLPASEAETLSVEQQLIEAVYLGLRQSAGLSPEELRLRYGVDFELVCGPLARALLADGRLELQAGRWCLTPQGMLFADRIVADFIAALN